MTAAAQSLLPASPAPDADHFVLLNHVSWATYCTVRELLDSPGIRMTYLKGSLEIMSPSRSHEAFKTRIARLIELYALEVDLPLYGYGGTTFRREEKERGAEPDECYTVNEDMGELPDIVLEVIVTSGGISKLEVYRGLGIPEVWMFQDGEFSLFALVDETYQRREYSERLPGLDFAELAELAAQPDQHATLKEYRSRLRAAASRSTP